MTNNAQQARGCTLRALAGEQIIEIDGELTVGRDESCDVVLQEGQTSRRHARLGARADGLWVEDLQSTNGTFINDKRLLEPALAAHGDVVRFDTMAFALSVAGADSADANVTVFRAVETPAPKPAAPKDQVVAARSGTAPPPSWALDGQQSVEGTVLYGALLKNREADALAAGSTAHAAVTTPTLIGLSEPVRDVRFQMVASGALNQWEIGRADSGDICIDHPSVSKNHAQIVNEGQRWKLIDLMSANGTYVNGVKGLTSYLNSGDTVRFGQVECRFLLSDEHTTQPHGSAAVAAAPQPGSRLKVIVISFAVSAALVAAGFWLLAG